MSRMCHACSIEEKLSFVHFFTPNIPWIGVYFPFFFRLFFPLFLIFFSFLLFLCFICLFFLIFFISFRFFFSYSFFILLFLIFLLCPQQNSFKRNQILNNLYPLLAAVASIFLVHPISLTQSVRPHLVYYHSLCSICVTYWMPWTLQREEEDFSSTGKYPRDMPLPTYLDYLQPKVTSF